ncbi:hypothetical protein AJ79_01922 [Helicocarpus griseus UAMH5409]|uniref:Uncharacterized protein n=1 Tax=Helicocarpus griseus UAMH5409 TaxID=1447875 RepID=A0A2B7Y4M8_9EURO|nr:hypothetical protein AJ79_01922 [Helicocarpus griseus UAMH5409]
MSSETPREGYAIRRDGGCLPDEDGEGTWREWHTCCPSGTVKKDYGDNSQCYLKSDQDKSGAVFSRCADPSWSLWEEAGFFCCEPNEIGFTDEKRDVYGCATEATFKTKYKGYIRAKSHDQPSTSPTSTAAPPPTATAPKPSTPKPTAPAESSTNVGGIVGGVVGGVCGVLIILAIVWFLLRRRRSRASNSQYVPTDPKKNSPAELYDPAPIRNELADSYYAPSVKPSVGQPPVRQEEPSELP